MNKLIFSTLCLALFGFSVASYAQNTNAFGFDSRGLFCAQDDTKEYVVFEMPNLSASQIKGFLFTKLSSLYKSPKDAITNISDSIIQLEGYAASVYRDTRSGSSYPVDFSFIIVIQVKDGKVRYDIPSISQIYMQNVPVLGTARLNMERPLPSLIENESNRMAVARYFNNLVDTLNNSIKAADEW